MYGNEKKLLMVKPARYGNERDESRYEMRGNITRYTRHKKEHFTQH